MKSVSTVIARDEEVLIFDAEKRFCLGSRSGALDADGLQTGRRSTANGGRYRRPAAFIELRGQSEIAGCHSGSRFGGHLRGLETGAAGGGKVRLCLQLRPRRTGQERPGGTRREHRRK